MLGGLGGPELLLILAVVLIFFGAKRLPQLANSLGTSVNSFKKGLKEGAAEAQLTEGKVVETEAQQLPEKSETKTAETTEA